VVLGVAALEVVEASVAARWAPVPQLGLLPVPPPGLATGLADLSAEGVEDEAGEGDRRAPGAHEADGRHVAGERRRMAKRTTDRRRPPF